MATGGRDKSQRGGSNVNEQQWAEAGDQVAELLARVYGPDQARFEQEARRRGCTLEEVAAAAVMGALRDFMDSLDVPGKESP
jgi:hypothetical protein